MDTNGDGLTDRLELNARLPLGEDEEVHSVKLLAVFRTRLRVKKIRQENLKKEKPQRILVIGTFPAVFEGGICGTANLQTA